MVEGAGGAGVVVEGISDVVGTGVDSVVLVSLKQSVSISVVE